MLSGLDTATEDVVFRRVLGEDGLFRSIGTTVILATHSGKCEVLLFSGKFGIFVLIFRQSSTFPVPTLSLHSMIQEKSLSRAHSMT